MKHLEFSLIIYVVLGVLSMIPYQGCSSNLSIESNKNLDISKQIIKTGADFNFSQRLLNHPESNVAKNPSDSVNVPTFRQNL